MSHPGWAIEGGYRVDVFGDRGEVTAEDVVEMWLREGVLDAAEAQRRTSEILLVGTHSDAGVVAVCTVYLQRSEQLRATLWHHRSFVAAAHRRSLVGLWLGVGGREYLEERHLAGEHPEAIGIVYEIESDYLKDAFPQAHWMPTDFQFIGSNPRGDDVRVHYFPGAAAPEPGST